MLKIVSKNVELTRDGNGYTVQVGFVTDLSIERPNSKITFGLDHDPSWDECERMVINHLAEDIRGEIKQYEAQIWKIRETLNQLKSEK